MDPSRSPKPVSGSDARSDVELARWRERVWERSGARDPRPQQEFRTPSGIALEPLYGGAADHGFPGEPPFTRGIRPTMYRGRLWTMRQYAGFANAAQTNTRFKRLLEQGQT